MAKRILVIDDEELLIRTFVKLLQKEGYDVLIAKRGSDALEIAEEASFDLIICDIRMPGIDGVETIKKLREVWSRRNVTNPPAIFVTGYADETTEARARELSPVAYIAKPFDTGKLLTRIRSILE